MQRRSATLAIYLGLSSLADGWVDRKLNKRLEEGKEHPERIAERRGVASVARPDGKLIWFHAASVGESLSLLELIRQLRTDYSDLAVLITTGTKSAAALLSQRLPGDVIHQFVPVDTKSSVTAFLEHWQPDVAVWTESEFWPRLMTMTRRRSTHMVLINGRISDKTRDGWRWFRAMSRRLLGFFDILLVQDEKAYDSFAAIGAPRDRLHVTGSLKEGSIPLPDDAETRKRLVKKIGARPVWLASSTHEGEEEIVARAHAIAKRRNPELLMILVPRHAERGDEIATQLRADGLKVAQRSGNEDIHSDTDVYLADTMGELGIWYRIAPLSFVGGSLVPVGGHNPFEPAALGSAIFHGPHVSNFLDIYRRLAAGNAAIQVNDAEGLAEALMDAMRPDRAAELAAAAWEVSSEGSGVTERVLDHLRPIFEQAGIR